MAWWACMDAWPQVGVDKARAVARAAQKPLIAVHHMEAHALVARLPATPVPGAVQQIVPQIPAPQPEQAAAPSTARREAAAVQQPQGQAQRPNELNAGTNMPSASSSGTTSGADVDPPLLSLGLSPGALRAVARVPFPFLCLLVSGGHNLLVLVRGPGDYVQLGTTLDDALGRRPGRAKARMAHTRLTASYGAECNSRVQAPAD